MAQFKLNIYGENDEIIKTHETDHVRWGVYMQALELQESIKGAPAAEQFAAINRFIYKIFPGLTEEELMDADGQDVFNTFKQLVNKAKLIGGSKN